MANGSSSKTTSGQYSTMTGKSTGTPSRSTIAQRKTSPARSQNVSKSKRARRTNEVNTRSKQGGRYLTRPTKRSTSYRPSSRSRTKSQSGISYSGQSSNNSNHTHNYQIDARGNGWLYEAVHPLNKNVGHRHRVLNFIVQSAQSNCYPNCKDQYGVDGSGPHNHLLEGQSEQSLGQLNARRNANTQRASSTITRVRPRNAGIRKSGNALRTNTNIRNMNVPRYRYFLQNGEAYNGQVNENNGSFYSTNGLQLDRKTASSKRKLIGGRTSNMSSTSGGTGGGTSGGGSMKGSGY